MTMRNLLTACCGVALLAACSADKPPTNEEAVPLLMEKTVGVKPEAMLKRLSGQILGEFHAFASGFASDNEKDWDAARFDKEIDAAYAPLNAQINEAFYKRVAAAMEEGEGAKLLAMLDDEGNAKVMQCAFSPGTGEQADPWAFCEEKTGGKASEEAKTAFNTLAGHFADALGTDETLSVAMGYATCGVIVKYGKEVSGDNLTLSFATTEIGPTGYKKPCPEYDKLAPGLLKGPTPPHFGTTEAAATGDAGA